MANEGPLASDDPVLLDAFINTWICAHGKVHRAYTLCGCGPSVERTLTPLEAALTVAASQPSGRALNKESAMGKKLFVGGLPWSTSDIDLKSAFELHGPVVEAKVITDRETGRSRGFGFVTMSTDADAAKAIKAMDGSLMGPRTINVNEAQERQGGGGGGGFRGGAGRADDRGGGGGGGRRDDRGDDSRGRRGDRGDRRDKW